MSLISRPAYFTEVDGLRTRYWDYGAGGSPLLLIHGIGGSLEAWHRNLESFAAQRRTIALDLPGSGRSDRPVPYPRHTLGYLADFLHDFLAQVAAGEPLFVVGSSFGGAVAMELAVRHPERVRGLVLVASSGFSTQLAWPLRIASAPLIGEYLTRPNRTNTGRSLRGLVADPAIVTDDEIDVAFELANQPGAQKAFLDLLRKYCTVFGVNRREIMRIQANLPQITMPTLIIWGELDSILPPAAAQVALARMPNARLTIMDGCGHMPYIEGPSHFNTLLADYIQKVESGAWRQVDKSAQDR